ncbi:MAG: STN domain-containing protein, partial [Pseudomonas sp.]
MPLRPSPLAQSLRAVLFGAGLSFAAVPAHADDSVARSYQIAPMSLEAALNQFGRESGVLISFGSQVTQGLQSPGLQGQYSAQQALDILLQDSGLQARAEGDNAY